MQPQYDNSAINHEGELPYALTLLCFRSKRPELQLQLVVYRHSVMKICSIRSELTHICVAEDLVLVRCDAISWEWSSKCSEGFCFLDCAFSIMKTKINQQNAQINSG